MPWEQKTVMQERERFVADVENRIDTVTALCDQYGISRKTGYKWIKRAAEGQRLCDQSRCPHQQPSKTARETEALILALREANPSWGGKTIKAVLESAGLEGIPSAKTCGNILKRNGCIDPLESKKHRPFQRFEREKCNDTFVFFVGQPVYSLLQQKIPNRHHRFQSPDQPLHSFFLLLQDAFSSLFSARIPLPFLAGFPLLRQSKDAALLFPYRPLPLRSGGQQTNRPLLPQRDNGILCFWSHE